MQPGAVMTCDDFRGIAISPILSKIYDYCLLDRLRFIFSSADNQLFSLRKVLDAPMLYLLQ